MSFETISKRPRRKYTNKFQKSILISVYELDIMPSRLAKIAVADKTNMSYKKVQNWFQNHRASDKNKSKFKLTPSGDNKKQVTEQVIRYLNSVKSPGLQIYIPVQDPRPPRPVLPGIHELFGPSFFK